MFRHLNLKMVTKIKTINWCLSVTCLLENYKTTGTKIEDLNNN